MTTSTNQSLLLQLRSKLVELLSADLRSLALFRIVLALLALADIIDGATSLIALYTDSGVLPRIVLLQEFSSQASFSLLLMSGDTLFQALLFLSAGLAAVALLVGWRTRLMTMIVWLFLVSLHERNPLVLNAGDHLLRLLFFWGMFLPLGAYWSIDRGEAAAPLRAPCYFSFATIGLFAQIVFIYAFGVLLKSGPEWRVDGTAIYYALSIDEFDTPLTPFLYQFPTLLKLLTFGVFWLEALGPLLLFNPVFTGPIRTVGVLAFMALHLGIRLTMSIGIFSWLAALCMVCFLPAWFWDHLVPQIRAAFPNHRNAVRLLRQPLTRLLHSQASSLRAGSTRSHTTLLAQTSHASRSSRQATANADAHHAGGTFGWLRTPWVMAAARFLHKAPLPHASDPPTAGAPTDLAELTRASSPHQRRWSIGINLCAAFFAGYILWWNLSTVLDMHIPAPPRTIGSYLRLDQEWSMFAPYPAKQGIWYVIPGTLRSGQQVDLLPVTWGDLNIHEGISWDKPRLVSRTYKNERWRKYLSNIRLRDHAEQVRYFARYLCRTWNAQHDGVEALEHFQIYYMVEPTLPNYQQAELQQLLLWNHKCF
jgi:hypothetical protein